MVVTGHRAAETPAIPDSSGSFPCAEVIRLDRRKGEIEKVCKRVLIAWIRVLLVQASPASQEAGCSLDRLSEANRDNLNGAGLCTRGKSSKALLHLTFPSFTYPSLRAAKGCEGRKKHPAIRRSQTPSVKQIRGLRRAQHFSVASFFLEIPRGLPIFARPWSAANARQRRGSSRSSTLTELEIEAIEMFINFLKLIGLPKSVGEIYGLLFVSPRPLAMDEIVSRLGLSLGAASQGLKVLRSLGAAKAVYLPGARRDHFTADLELSKFATVFIKEELHPRIERALERIHHLESLVPNCRASIAR